MPLVAHLNSTFCLKDWRPTEGQSMYFSPFYFYKLVENKTRGKTRKKEAETRWQTIKASTTIQRRQLVSYT